MRWRCWDQFKHAQAGLLDCDRAGDVVGPIKLGGHFHVRAFVQIPRRGKSGRVKDDFVALVVPGIRDHKLIGAQIQKGDTTAEGKLISGRGQDGDVVGDSLTLRVRCKGGRDQGALLQSRETGGSGLGCRLPLANDSCSGGYDEPDGLGRQRLAHRQGTGAGIVAHDLSVAFAFRQSRQHMNAAGEYRVSIQHGFDRSGIIGAEIAQRRLRAIPIDQRALVEEDLHLLAAEDLQRQAIGNWVHSGDRAADDGALSLREGEQIRRRVLLRRNRLVRLSLCARVCGDG